MATATATLSATKSLGSRHSLYYGQGYGGHGLGYGYGCGDPSYASTTATRKPTRPQASSARSPSGSARSRMSSYSVKGQQSTRSGDKIYYRLLTYNEPYPSLYPLDTDDGALSFIHEARTPIPSSAPTSASSRTSTSTFVPRTTDVLTAICTRERIHPSRARLYVPSSRPLGTATAKSAYAYAHPDTYTLLALSAQDRRYSKRADAVAAARAPQYVLADPDAPLRPGPGPGPGSPLLSSSVSSPHSNPTSSSSLSLAPTASPDLHSLSMSMSRSQTYSAPEFGHRTTRKPNAIGTRNTPLILLLSVDPSRPRIHAASPAGALERRGRQVARAVRRGAVLLERGLGAVFGAMQKVPKGMEG